MSQEQYLVLQTILQIVYKKQVKGLQTFTLLRQEREDQFRLQIVVEMAHYLITVLQEKLHTVVQQLLKQEHISQQEQV